MDLRIKKTYSALLAAFTKLLETRRYEEVTVALLCEEAMIRRTTFYKHFADKSAFFAFFVDNLRIDLLKKGEQSIEAAGQRDDASAVVLSERTGEVDEEGLAILRGLVDFMLEHEALVDNTFASSMSGMLTLMMVDKVAETIRERHRARHELSANNPVSLAAASEFAAGGIVRLLEKWWKSGHSRAGEDELITMANTMVTRVLAV